MVHAGNVSVSGHRHVCFSPGAPCHHGISALNGEKGPTASALDPRLPMEFSYVRLILTNSVVHTSTTRKLGSPRTEKLSDICVFHPTGKDAHRFNKFQNTKDDTYYRQISQWLTSHPKKMALANLGTEEVRRAIGRAQDSSHNNLTTQETRLLQSAFDQIWRNLRTHQSTYLLCDLEFKVFNYYQDSWPNQQLAQQAVQRYWNNRPAVDGPER